MIHTRADLEVFLQQHELLHRKAGRHLCTCGWNGLTQPDGPTPWEEHGNTLIVIELADLLPSSAVDRDTGETLSWSELVHDLHEATHTPRCDHRQPPPGGNAEERLAAVERAVTALTGDVAHLRKLVFDVIDKPRYVVSDEPPF
jgi:hypothetical protein